MITFARCRRGDAVALLYALRKKEQYEARGFYAFVYHGIFPSDDLYEVWVYRRPRDHGSFVT